MAKKKSGKAMPILSICFFGVSLILFFIKSVAHITFVLVNSAGTSMLRTVLTEVLQTALLMFPAVLFIIAAALYLKKSKACAKLYSAALLTQLISALGVLAVLVMQNDLLHFKKSDYDAYTLSFFYILIAFFTLVALIASLRRHTFKPFVIIACCAGFAAAAVLVVMNIHTIYVYRSFYAANILLLVLKSLDNICLALAIVFYYIAYLFTAFFQKFPVASNKVTVQIKNAAK